MEPDRYAPGQVLVRLVPDSNDQDLQALLDLVQGTLIRSYQLVPDLHQIEVRIPVPEAVEILEDQEAVEYAHPNYHLYPSALDGAFDQQWGFETDGSPIQWNGKTYFPDPDADVRALDGWTWSTGSGNTVVAIIDTGLDVGHPDLAPNLWRSANGDVGWDAFTHSGVERDYSSTSHGTRIAGIIGAAEGDPRGAKSVVGLNWSCKLMPLAFLKAGVGKHGNVATKGDVANAIGALQVALKNGVKISNNSYGATSIPDACSLKDAIENAGKQGHLFVCGAGNEGLELSYVPPALCALAEVEVPGLDTFYPASWHLPNMIVVTSTKPDDSLAPNANWGMDVVDIAAPGNIIFSTAKGGYGFDSGTSYATAFVSGAAALYWDAHPSASMQDVKQRILESGRALASLKGKVLSGRVLDVGNLMFVLSIDVHEPTLREQIAEFIERVRDGTIELKLVPSSSP